MRYWWVNQNQTYRHEVQGGYLWSPKRNANGARNPFYESMREVAPGDLIFSFMDTRILAVGMAQSFCWESPKPLEFGNAGQNWENIGWKVKVNFTQLANKIRPKDHIDILRPLLPERYSPLQPTGNGLQSVYLTELPAPLAEVLIGLIGEEIAPIAAAAHNVKPVPADDLEFWERKLEQELASDPTIAPIGADFREHHSLGLMCATASDAQPELLRLSGIDMRHNPIVRPRMIDFQDRPFRLNKSRGVQHAFRRVWLRGAPRPPSNGIAMETTEMRARKRGDTLTIGVRRSSRPTVAAEDDAVSPSCSTAMR